MRYLEIDGARISVIGLGTWQFGSRESGYGRDYSGREATAIVHRALDLGITLLDTAEVYAFGRSERIVGGAIRTRRDAREIFLATKLLPVLPIPQIVQQRGRASARRLGVGTIDLYQVHWPNPLVPLSTQMLGMRRLQEAGVVRRIGVSNFSLRQWVAAEDALGTQVLSNQVRYSLVSRSPEDDLVPYARERGRLVIAYSPLGQGLLSARYDAAHPPSGAVRKANPLFVPENLERAAPMLRTLRDVAREHGVTPAQIALAWVIRHENVVAIPGASSVAQVEANAAAADVVLTPEQQARLTGEAHAFRPLGTLRALPSLARARLRRSGRSSPNSHRPGVDSGSL